MTYIVGYYLKIMRSPTITSSFRETSERNPRSLVSWNPLHGTANYPYKKVQISLLFFYSQPSGIANMRSELR